MIVGSGPEEASSRNLSAQLGLGDVVRFYPSTPKHGELLDAFDVFVHTSSFEGLPMVVLEAMAAGVPVVAQAAGGTAKWCSTKRPAD